MINLEKFNKVLGKTCVFRKILKLNKKFESNPENYGIQYTINSGTFEVPYRAKRNETKR